MITRIRSGFSNVTRRNQLHRNNPEDKSLEVSQMENPSRNTLESQPNLRLGLESWPIAAKLNPQKNPDILVVWESQVVTGQFHCDF